MIIYKGKESKIEYTYTNIYTSKKNLRKQRKTFTGSGYQDVTILEGRYCVPTGLNSVATGADRLRGLGQVISPLHASVSTTAERRQ